MSEKKMRPVAVTRPKVTPKVTEEEKEHNRREAIREATKLAILLHGDALQELGRY